KIVFQEDRDLNQKLMEHLMRAPYPSDGREEFKKSILFHAAKLGDRELFERGLKIFSMSGQEVAMLKNKRGKSLDQVALDRGRLQLLLWREREGGAILSEEAKQVLLLRAVAEGDVEGAKKYIKEMESLSSFGGSVVSAALKLGKKKGKSGNQEKTVELLQLLQAKGVPMDVNMLDAVATNSAPITAFLLNHGAIKNLNARATTGSKESALLMAIEQDNLDLVKILLQAGADPNLADGKGVTPLCSIIASNKKLRHYQQLLAALMSIPGLELSKACMKNSMTPFMLAIQKQNMEAMSCLYQQKQSLDLEHKSIFGDDAHSMLQFLSQQNVLSIEHMQFINHILLEMKKE
ncbi:MAG: ankyrin repeat domain-containing protein, partial [Oligoflexia bacterium]|nr:ankyrin repeat domain-containing protein [Oligoflexia bacterium]